jgi:hypothetical protein
MRARQQERTINERVFGLVFGLLFFVPLYLDAFKNGVADVPRFATSETAWVWVIFFLVYSLPYMVAEMRQHHNQLAIGVLNLLLGWTVIGWFVALVWASTAVEKRAPPVRSPWAVLVKSPWAETGASVPSIAASAEARRSGSTRPFWSDPRSDGD